MINYDEKVLDDIFESIDDCGVMTIPAWYEVPWEKADSGYFYKCEIKCDIPDHKVFYFDMECFCSGISMLADYYTVSGVEFGCEPELDDPDDIDEDNMYKAWELHFKKDIQSVSDQIEYQMVIRGRRICKLLCLNAPDVIIRTEMEYYTKAFVLNYCAKSVKTVAVSPDKDLILSSDIKPKKEFPGEDRIPDETVVISLER